MIAAVWQVAWWVPWTLPAAGLVVLWWLMRRAHRQEAERAASTERSIVLIRDELARRRQTSGWFQSQAYFDAECECIEIAEQARSRRTHPSNRKPRA